MIVVDGVTKRFGGRPAVQDVSLRVEPGEVVGFLGPNGAGKSTTMRVVLGLLRPDEGRSEVDGDVGYLPEGHVGYEGLSVRAYLRFLGRAKGLARRDEAAEHARVLGAVDVADLASRPMGRLSKGQRQRVGIAQALLGAPANYVFDEPTAGLDPRQVTQTRALLRGLADEGAAVLVSTHLLAEAAATCDRIVVIVKGRVVATERPDEIDDLEDRFLRLVAEAELS